MAAKMYILKVPETNFYLKRLNQKGRGMLNSGASPGIERQH